MKKLLRKIRKDFEDENKKFLKIKIEEQGKGRDNRKIKLKRIKSIIHDKILLNSKEL